MAIRKHDTVETAFQAEASRLTEWRPSDHHPTDQQPSGCFANPMWDTGHNPVDVREHAINLLYRRYLANGGRESRQRLADTMTTVDSWVLEALEEALTKGMP